MGVIRRIAFSTAMLCVMCLTVLLSSCNSSFRCADINLYGVPLSKVYATCSSAYYLSESGTLYCTGADSDAGSFVSYQNQKEGIVAENVKFFREMLGGGCYINNNGDLYMWNESIEPLYGYNKKDKHIKILDGIKFVDSGRYCMIYIDIESNLYLIGSFLGETHDVKNPKLLATNVSCADINHGTVIWATTNGRIDAYGEKRSDVLEAIAMQKENAHINDIRLTNSYLAVLCDEQLWFYGDYVRLTTGDESQVVVSRLLSNDIAAISDSASTFAALTKTGDVLLWGRCVSNDKNNTKSTQFGYYEAFCVTKNAEDVFVSGSCVCYIGQGGTSNIFYADGWADFYGNATKDPCVGVNRAPNTWVREN